MTYGIWNDSSGTFMLNYKSVSSRFVMQLSTLHSPMFSPNDNYKIINYCYIGILFKRVAEPGVSSSHRDRDRVCCRGNDRGRCFRAVTHTHLTEVGHKCDGQYTRALATSIRTRRLKAHQGTTAMYSRH